MSTGRSQSLLCVNGMLSVAACLLAGLRSLLCVNGMLSVAACLLAGLRVCCVLMGCCLLLQVYWQVSEEQKKACKTKGKDSMECQNYIKTLETLDDGRMLVCGTNAYNPTCDYMTYTNGTLTLQGKKEEGRGKVPFDPFQRSTSVMVGEYKLYSATVINFLGTKQVLQRHSFPAIRTEHRLSWLNKPSFVQLDVVPESINNLDGDDDKVYMFFSEEAMEFDLPDQIRVSRVARVCKGDMGGQRTLQQRWTSYLKARLDCPVPLDTSLPAIIQDVFLLKDQDWRKSVFYAVFSPQTTTSDLSTVCAFSVADIGKVFAEGRYMTPVTMESETRWVTHTGWEPVPRPGACMNNAARDLGIEHSLDLPDKTLQFVRDRPLMEGAVPPLTGGPLVLQRGAKFSVIVVDRVMAVDGEIYHVMFIGTEEGTVQKAVQYADGDTVIIEEIQVFQTLEPIKVLRLSSGTGQLYAGSESGVVQIPVRDCGRYGSCLDCILARNPYCAWDTTSAACSSVANLPTGSRNMYQSLIHADASMCPRSGRFISQLVKYHSIHLLCQPASNLAQVSWHFARQPLQLRDRYQMLGQDLLIVSAVASDAGRYTCQSLEEVKGRLYTRTEAAYILQPTKTLLVLQISVAVLSVLLGVGVLWSVWRHFRLHPAEPGKNNNNNRRTGPGCVPGSEVNNNHTIITIEDMEDNQTARVSVALLSMILGSLMLWNISRDQLSHRVFRMEEGLQDHMSPFNSSSDAVIHMGDI
uniref:Sema domain-containing protein n=1 Tax=Hucho hucho TaxID=62062 RepID=A0A4W5NTS8_9TELE